jgi:hypothetical protein
LKPNDEMPSGEGEEILLDDAADCCPNAPTPLANPFDCCCCCCCLTPPNPNESGLGALKLCALVLNGIPEEEEEDEEAVLEDGISGDPVLSGMKGWRGCCG